MRSAVILHVRTMTKTGLRRHSHSICPLRRSHPPIQSSPLEVLSPTLLKTRNQLSVSFALFSAVVLKQVLRRL